MLLECSGEVLECEVGNVHISEVDIGWEQFVPLILQIDQRLFQVFNDGDVYPDNSRANEENKASLCLLSLHSWILVGRVPHTQSTSSIMSPEPPLNIIGVSIVPKRLPASELGGDAEEATLCCVGWNASVPTAGSVRYSGVRGEGSTLLSDAVIEGGEAFVTGGGEKSGDPHCWPALPGEEWLRGILSSIDFGTRTRRKL